MAIATNGSPLSQVFVALVKPFPLVRNAFPRKMELWDAVMVLTVNEPMPNTASKSISALTGKRYMASVDRHAPPLNQPMKCAPAAGTALTHATSPAA